MATLPANYKQVTLMEVLTDYKELEKINEDGGASLSKRWEIPCTEVGQGKWVEHEIEVYANGNMQQFCWFENHDFIEDQCFFTTIQVQDIAGNILFEQGLLAKLDPAGESLRCKLERTQELQENYDKVARIFRKLTIVTAPDVEETPDTIIENEDRIKINT